MRERVSVFLHASVDTDLFARNAAAISRDRKSHDNAHITPARYFHTLCK